jgi:hypothetical protein
MSGDDPTQNAAPGWVPLDAMWSAEQAEHACVAGYELTAFVLAADRAKGWDREIGWEVHGGAKLLDLIATCSANSFEDAKAQAEAAWHRSAYALSNAVALRPEPHAKTELRPAAIKRFPRALPR